MRNVNCPSGGQDPQHGDESSRKQCLVRTSLQTIVLPLGSQGTDRATVECPTQLRVVWGGDSIIKMVAAEAAGISMCQQQRSSALEYGERTRGIQTQNYRKQYLASNMKKVESVKQPSVMASNQFIYSQARHNNHAPQTPPWPNASSK